MNILLLRLSGAPPPYTLLSSCRVSADYLDSQLTTALLASNHVLALRIVLDSNRFCLDFGLLESAQTLHPRRGRLCFWRVPEDNAKSCRSRSVISLEQTQFFNHN